MVHRSTKTAPPFRKICFFIHFVVFEKLCFTNVTTLATLIQSSRRTSAHYRTSDLLLVHNITNFTRQKRTMTS